MSETLISLIESVILSRQPDARDVDILSSVPLNAWHPNILSVQVSWKADELIHLDYFAVELREDGLLTGGDRRLLELLAETPVPVPRPVLQGAEVGVGVVLEQLSSRTLSDSISSISMRWELSAAAFSFARALAGIHRLDWRQVAPWMADPESLPEDIIDDQVGEAWAVWETQIAQLPVQLRPRAERVLSWLDLRRPVDVSVCLCHGSFIPANLLVVDDEISTILCWQNAQVTDASFDVALLPLHVQQLGLAPQDTELFLQAVFGDYLQSSPRSLGNLPFYMVARLMSPALSDALKAPEDQERISQLFSTVELAMEHAARAPWRTA